MANLKSSKKDIKRSIKRRDANQKIRTALKTYVKRVREAIESGDKEKISAAVQTCQTHMDKAVQLGVIHKNQAARRKSRIASAAQKALNA